MRTVRTAEGADKRAVAGVHVRSWQAAYRGLMPDAYLDGLDPDDRAARYTFGSDDPLHQSTIVSVEDGTIDGFATMGPSRDADLPDTGEVYAIYVDPGSWGLGVGRLLMETARSRLINVGCTRGVLWVLEGNARAQRFYEIDGWVLDGARRSEERWSVATNEVRYRRALP
jgi:GNAT superfamily N-acetyltransferase